MSKTITIKAANEISKLMIDREHSVRMAKIWETTQPDESVSEHQLWIWQCRRELEALKIEETLRDEYGIRLRDDWASMTLEEEIKLVSKAAA